MIPEEIQSSATQMENFRHLQYDRAELPLFAQPYPSYVNPTIEFSEKRGRKKRDREVMTNEAKNAKNSEEKKKLLSKKASADYRDRVGTKQKEFLKRHNIQLKKNIFLQRKVERNEKIIEELQNLLRRSLFSK